MKYTKKEIKLYEALTNIYSVSNEMFEIFNKNIFNYANQDREQMNRWVRKIVDNLVELDRVLKEAKIPKKFLILNKLENKDG